MLLERLRRHDARWDEQLRRYLFTEEPITARNDGWRAGQSGPRRVAPAIG